MLTLVYIPANVEDRLVVHEKRNALYKDPDPWKDATKG